MLGLMLATAILFTDPSANVGASTWTWPGGVTTTANAGYLQVTGQGTGILSPLGWSHEIEFPEVLHVAFPEPVDVTSITFGRVFPPELASINATPYFPTFVAGAPNGFVTWTGLLSGIDGLDVFGIGAGLFADASGWINPGIGSNALLYEIAWTPHRAPGGPGPVAVSEPDWRLLMGMGALWMIGRAIFGWRHASRVIARVRAEAR